ncbi:DUF922 domain-containing protein [Chryseobacterium herbae]|uniref:DUF922 domain-containing protein n=1 Tax=Chryseobacterium herbae TaxID=2976476 RepID=A0ABT2INC7_9FLAO|nr:DUF922 domain-containing protein [Chryseobacterium sp. pc1-10]MCT2560328.1 DUF922 domain-containing protein [Chryseobacterium sp. pc1-10]
MKLISLFCLLALNTLFGQKIIWNEDRKLVWEDFKSPVNRKNNPDVAAYTHCGWEYSVVKSTNPKSSVKIEITAIFNVDRSWKDTKRMNDYILLHEQKHFDIAELFARRLRKEVEEKIKTSGDYDKNFKTLYQKISNDYKNFQISYDKITEHGINKEKQAEYNALIAEEIDHLKSYKVS